MTESDHCVVHNVRSKGSVAENNRSQIFNMAQISSKIIIASMRLPNVVHTVQDYKYELLSEYASQSSGIV